MKPIIFLFAIIFMLSSTSCSKDDDDVVPEQPSCRITKVVSATGKVINITYNEDGNIQKVENGEVGETLTSVYTAGAITITGTNNSTGEVERILKFLLNSSGMVYGYKQESYTSGILTSTLNIAYEYNGTELAKSYSTGGGSTSTVTYGWTEGNVTSEVSDTGVSVYEYYIDKPIQQGDMILLIGMLYNGFDYSKIIKNRNLIKFVANEQYDYTFDADGRISSISENGALLYNLTYECN